MADGKVISFAYMQLIFNHEGSMNPGVVVGSEVKISHICRVQLNLKPFEGVVSDSHYNLSVSLSWNEINQHEDDH